MPPKRKQNEAQRLRTQTFNNQMEQKQSKKQKQADVARERREEKARRDYHEANEVHKLLTRAITEKLQPIARSILRPEATKTSEATPDSRHITRHIRTQPMQLFFCMIPDEIWANIQEETSKEIDRKKREGEMSSSYARKYGRTPVPVRQLKLVVARRLCRTFSIPVTKSLSLKREKAIASSFRWSWDIVLPVLRLTWQSCIIPTENVSVDEALFQYNPQGKQKPDCPKR